MLSGQQRNGNQRAWTNGRVQEKQQLPEHRYHISTPKYSSQSSTWHNREASSHTTPDRSNLHTRQRSDASHELEYDPSNDPIRSSVVDGMLQSLNRLPDASGPFPVLEPIQTSFPNGRFHPSADCRDWRRGRARSPHGGSFSSDAPAPSAIDEQSVASSAASTPKKPFLHVRRHTAHNSRGRVGVVAPELSDTDRRNLAKTREKFEKGVSDTFYESTRVPRPRVKQGVTDMDAFRNNQGREDSPSSDFDLNPQDHQSRRRSRSYHQVSESILNRARPVPAKYHVFDDDVLIHPEAQRVALRKPTTQPHTPERSESFSSTFAAQGLFEPKIMAHSNHGSVGGSVSGGADSPFSRLRDAGVGATENGNNQSTRAPHSQSFTSPSSSLRTETDSGDGKPKERPGLLKRMFGSSKNSSSSSDLKQQAPQLPPLTIQDEQNSRRSQAALGNQAAKAGGASHRLSAGQVESEKAPKTPPRQQQQLRSKSSFFRRRRKLSVEQEMPQMSVRAEAPPTHGAVANHGSNRPSTSSLKQVMNPYLNNAAPPKRLGPDPDEIDLGDVLEAPVQRPPEAQNAYEFLRSASPGAVGQGPRGEAQDRRNSATALKKHRQRPSTSAVNEPERLQDVEMESKKSARDSPVLSSEAKASRRRSATSTAARGLETTPSNDSSNPLRRESQAVSRTELSGANVHVSTHAYDDTPQPPSRNVKEQDSWLAARAPSPCESNRVWIQSRDSSEENLSAPVPTGDLEHESVPSLKPIDVASDSSVTYEDFKSANSVPAVQLDPHHGDRDNNNNNEDDENDDEDVVSPLPTPDHLPPSSLVSNALSPVHPDEERALRIFEAQSDPHTRAQGAIELGEAGEAADRLRAAFMSYFDFAGLNILLALRDLCARMTLKGETQQIDRVMSAFSRRWCDCNPNHGFKSVDVVHTICYSLLLLNTDLHVADLTDKMTRNQFVKNTIPTLRRVAEADLPSADSTVTPKTEMQRPSIPFGDDQTSSTLEPDMRNSADDRNTASRMSTKRSLRPTSEIPSLKSPGPYEMHPADASELLVDSPHEGTMKTWESVLETVLKEYYLSIRQLKLPLHGAEDVALSGQPSVDNLSAVSNIMRRTGSVISKAPSEDSRGRPSALRSAASRFASKNRSRPRLYPTSTLGSSRTASRTSLDDVWSPSASSLNSQGRSLTTMSTDSLHSKFLPSELGYQQSIGFANALSHVIIREEGSYTQEDYEESGGPLLDDDRLELAGAPWAKEGILQHKHHLESEGKKAKDRNWSECFAVIQRGSMRLFSFNSKSSTRSQKSKPAKSGGVVVGGGNWLENAESLASFTLRHTIANALPQPGYSKQRPHVFALSLPTGAVHLFHVGTAEIAQEFVMTANYWSARLSKEPLIGGVSSIEYGWGEAVINNALLGSSSTSDAELTVANKVAGTAPPSSFHIPRTESSLSTPANDRTSSSCGRSLHSPTPSATFSFSTQSNQPGDRNNSMSGRPSISGSLRSSFDAPRPAAFRNRLPADRLVLGSWQPPQQSLMPSRIPEPEQLAALKAYVTSIEEELAQHNELRAGVVLAFSPRSVNAGRALGNWERKSHYLLREIVKFRTYVDVLAVAEARRDEVKKDRGEIEENRKKGKVREARTNPVEEEEDLELSEETLEALRGVRKTEEEE